MSEQNIDFGDYVEIEQKRYGVPNEMFLYKVVAGNFESNAYRAVPIDANEKKPTMASPMAPVLLVICCGVCEEKVEKVRLEDVRYSGNIQLIK